MLAFHVDFGFYFVLGYYLGFVVEHLSHSGLAHLFDPVLDSGLVLDHFLHLGPVLRYDSLPVHRVLDFALALHAVLDFDSEFGFYFVLLLE